MCALNGGTLTNTTSNKTLEDKFKEQTYDDQHLK